MEGMADFWGQSEGKPVFFHRFKWGDQNFSMGSRGAELFEVGLFDNERGGPEFFSFRQKGGPEICSCL